MNRWIWILLVCVAAAAWSGAGSADTPSRWTTRLGYAHASFDTDSSLSLAGMPAPGAAVMVEDQGILMGDIGFDLTDQWTARVAMGAPVVVPVLAGGALRGLSPPLTGTLGEIEIAPVVVTLLYAPREIARFQPYLGAGAAYTYILDAKSRDVAALEATSGWGAVLQAGCNFAITPQLWAFADARKVYFATTASGVVPALGGLPVAAAITLDPLIVNAGIGYRF